MKFRYFRLPLPEHSGYFGSSLLKPIIPVGVRHGDIVIDYAALIDSGADFCILGQKGFFDLFSIKFDLAKEQVEIKERL